MDDLVNVFPQPRAECRYLFWLVEHCVSKENAVLILPAFASHYYWTPCLGR